MPDTVSARIFRQDGASIQTGKFVAYGLQGIPFGIYASRHGVEVRGHFPLTGKAGIELLKEFLDRAVIHHIHLASYQYGEHQQVLEEDTVVQRLNPPPRMLVFAPTPEGNNGSH